MTDEALNILTIHGMEPSAQTVTLTVDGITYAATVMPNEVYTLDGGKLTLSEKVAFEG